jgi:hypothetical protein
MMDEICCCGAKMSPLASTIGPSVKPVNISSTVPASSSNANLATGMTDTIHTCFVRGTKALRDFAPV